MDISKSTELNETVPDQAGQYRPAQNPSVHSNTDDKSLNPTKEHYGEVISLLEWLNRNFYSGDLVLPMVTFRTGLNSFGVYVPKEWDHKTGTPRPGFRLNAQLFRDSDFQTQCMELLGLMEHVRQGKVTRTNYHDRDYGAGMKAHGLQTHRVGDPDKETGERIMLSVISGGKFEKLIAKKQESGFAFSWAIRHDEPQASTAVDGEETKKEAKSGRKFKYACPVEDCSTAFWGKDGQKGGCFEHDPPVLLEQID